MQTADNVILELKKVSSPEKAKTSSWFFKCGPGQYGEGDKFIGVTVPNQRKVAANHRDLPLPEIHVLLKSPIHEHRLTSLIILVNKYKKSDEKDKKKIVDFYLSHTKYINNWDLVDTSAGNILGEYLSDKDKDVLYKLAISKNIWERRIAVISTLAFIFQGNVEDTFKISELLLTDTHDLIHKAVGWMLREAGKRVSMDREKEFLKKHYKYMPRTMLRYAIERMDAHDKDFFMKKKIIYKK